MGEGLVDAIDRSIHRQNQKIELNIAAVCSSSNPAMCLVPFVSSPPPFQSQANWFNFRWQTTRPSGDATRLKRKQMTICRAPTVGRVCSFVCVCIYPYICVYVLVLLVCKCVCLYVCNYACMYVCTLYFGDGRYGSALDQTQWTITTTRRHSGCTFCFTNNVKNNIRVILLGAL